LNNPQLRAIEAFEAVVSEADAIAAVAGNDLANIITEMADRGAA
jgi:hypothetical protein